MTTGTKPVTKKVREECPPLEVRDNTKARRAWLAAKAAEIDALPNHSAKIVGQGSYQVVSVYETTYVEGRLRHRGTCQFCGALQVVQAGALVLHGYARPGWGFIVNVCPGAGLAPLNLEKVKTEGWLALELEALPKLKEADRILADRAAAAEKAITENRYIALDAFPRVLDGFGRRVKNPTEAQKADHAVAVAAWRVMYPTVSAWRDATDKASNARNNHQACLQKIAHFRGLLASGVHGTALVAEVVP